MRARRHNQAEEREFRTVPAGCRTAVPILQAVSGSQRWRLGRSADRWWAAAHPPGKNGSLHARRRPFGQQRFVLLRRSRRQCLGGNRRTAWTASANSPCLHFQSGKGCPADRITSVHAAKEGGVWLGTSDGVNRWTNEHLTIYRRRAGVAGPAGAALAGVRIHEAGLGEVAGSGIPGRLRLFHVRGRAAQPLGGNAQRRCDFQGRWVSPRSWHSARRSFSIAGDGAGNVWISHDEALFHVRHERVVERLPWASFGRKQPARALLHDSGQDGLWIGFLDGGVAFYQNNQLRASYAGRRRGSAGAGSKACTVMATVLSGPQRRAA